MPPLKQWGVYTPTFKKSEKERNRLKASGHRVYGHKDILAIMRQEGRPYITVPSNTHIQAMVAKWIWLDRKILKLGGDLAQDYKEANEDEEEPLEPLGDDEPEPQEEDFREEIQDPYAETFPDVKAPSNKVMKADLERWGLPTTGLRLAEDLKLFWLPAERARLAKEAGIEVPEKGKTGEDAEADEMEMGVDVKPTSNASKATKAPKAEKSQTKKPRAANKKTADKTDRNDTSPSRILALRIDPDKLRTLLPGPEVTRTQTRPKARARATPQPKVGTRTSPRTKKTHDPDSGTTVSAAPSRTEANLADQATDDDVVIQEMADEQSPMKKATKLAWTKAVQPAKRKRKDPEEQAANKRQKVVEAQEVSQQAVTSQPDNDIRMADVEDGIGPESQTPETASELQNAVEQVGFANLGLVRDEQDKQALLRRLTDGKQVYSNKLKLGCNPVRPVPATTAATPFASIDTDGNGPAASRLKAKDTAKPRIVVNFHGKGTKLVARTMTSETSKQPAEHAQDEGSRSSERALLQPIGTLPQHAEVLQPFATNVERVANPGFSSATPPINTRKISSSTAEHIEDAGDKAGKNAEINDDMDDDEDETSSSASSDVDTENAESDDDEDTVENVRKANVRPSMGMGRVPRGKGYIVVKHKVDSYLTDITIEELSSINPDRLNVAELQLYNMRMLQKDKMQTEARGERWHPPPRPKKRYTWRGW
jgi:hypothetical protein